MFANERQQKILSVIKQRGSVTTAELTQLFKVSVETVRRDLLLMEKQGLLKRVFGGAVGKSELVCFHSLSQRTKENREKKLSLTQRAALEVENGDVISIDSGSTAVLFAAALSKRLDRLTVVTNSLEVLNTLSDHRDFKVILCGGAFSKKENCFLGELTTSMLGQIYVNKAFVFPVALSLEGGICNHTAEFVALQKQMVKMAEKVYVLADSTKIEKRDLYKQSELQREYTYITDGDLPDSVAELYNKSGFRLITD